MALLCVPLAVKNNTAIDVRFSGGGVHRSTFLGVEKFEQKKEGIFAQREPQIMQRRRRVPTVNDVTSSHAPVGVTGLFCDNESVAVVQSLCSLTHVCLVTVSTGSCCRSILLAWAEWQL